MHELSVTESILNIASKHAQEAGATHVTDVYLVIGQLSSIIDDSVQFYWDIISKDGICEGARLHFQRIPARLKCLACETEYILEADLMPCPACQSANVMFITGNDFYLESIEISK